MRKEFESMDELDSRSSKQSSRMEGGAKTQKLEAKPGTLLHEVQISFSHIRFFDIKRWNISGQHGWKSRQHCAPVQTNQSHHFCRRGRLGCFDLSQKLLWLVSHEWRFRQFWCLTKRIWASCNRRRRVGAAVRLSGSQKVVDRDPSGQPPCVSSRSLLLCRLKTSTSQSPCLFHLKRFADSLSQTSWDIAMKESKSKGLKYTSKQTRVGWIKRFEKKTVF